MSKIQTQIDKKINYEMTQNSDGIEFESSQLRIEFSPQIANSADSRSAKLVVDCNDLAHAQIEIIGNTTYTRSYFLDIQLNIFCKANKQLLKFQVLAQAMKASESSYVFEPRTATGSPMFLFF